MGFETISKIIQITQDRWPNLSSFFPAGKKENVQISHKRQHFIHSWGFSFLTRRSFMGLSWTTALL